MRTERMAYMFALILLISKESGVMTFPWRKFGLYTVDACPGNRTEWKEASRRLNCTMQPNVFENRYHCVAIRNLTRLVEFCYPYTRSIFEKGQCVILDPPFTLNNYTCLHFTGGCPKTHYHTDQIYNYPNCIRIKPALKCFIADELCLKKSRVTTMENEEMSTIQTFIAENITKQEIDSASTTAQVQEEINLVSVIVPTFILLGILFGIVIFVMIWWKRKQRTEFYERKDQETDQHETDNFNNTISKQQVESIRKDEDISDGQYVTSCKVGQQRNQEHGSEEEKKALLSDQGCPAEDTNISENFIADNVTNITSEEYIHDDSMSTTDLHIKKEKEKNLYAEKIQNPILEKLAYSDRKMKDTDSKDSHYEYWKKEERTKLQKMIGTTKAMLNEFERKNCSFFVTTRASKKIMKVIEERKCVFIKGNQGDGKTTLAKHAICRLTSQKKLKPVQLFSLKKIYGNVPIYSRMVIFLDNIFGEMSVSDDEVHGFRDQKDLIEANLLDDGEGNGNILIATLRNDIHKECENKLKDVDFFKYSIVDISDNEHKLNMEEVDRLASKYAVQNIDEPLRKNLMNTDIDRKIGIPQCIKLLKDKAEDAQSKRNIPEIFEHPVKHLRKEIKQRIEEKEHKTAVLIYIVLCGGSIEDEILKNPLKDRKKKSKALKIMELEENASSLKKFHDSIRFIEDLYIEHDDIEKQYRFSHSSIQETIFIYMYQHYRKDIICSCDPSLLSSLANTNASLGTIKIDSEFFPDIIDSIGILIRGRVASRFRSISLMPLWYDDEFSEEVMKNEGCIETMIYSVDENEDSMLVHFSEAENVKWVNYLLPRSSEKQRYKSLNKACSCNHAKVVELILKTNVVFDLKTCFYAVQSGNIEILFKFTDNIDFNQTEFSNSPRWSHFKVGLLHEICLFGQNELIGPLLEQYPLLCDVQNEQGGNALHFVAFTGQKDAFKKLISCGSDPYSRSHHGSTVLHYACQNGKVDMVKHIYETYPELLKKDFDDYDGHSPLHFAAQSSNLDLFSYLLTVGKNVNDLTNNGKSVLHISCMAGQLQMCKYLVENHPKLLEVVDKNGYSVLNDAAWGGNVEIFKLLIGRGLEVESTTNIGKTVLHYCCMNGELEMCKFLVNKYPDLLNVIDNDGYTVLHDAAKGGNLDLFSYLLSIGKNVNDLTNDGESVLHISCMAGQLQMCKYLVKNHPKLLEVIDNVGETVLHGAAGGGNIDVFKFLIDKGLDVKSKTNIGETVLHVCCMHGKLEMCKYLVNKYLDLLNAIDKDGYTVLHHAAMGGNLDLFSYLLTVGKNVNDLTQNGYSVLHISCAKGDLEMCKYLVKYHNKLLDVMDKKGYTALNYAELAGSTDVLKLLLNKGF